MRTTFVWLLLGTLAGGFGFGPSALRGQELDAAAVQYGAGVHAYFAGNSSRAEQSLSNALALDSQDPRIYYFRALSLLRQGRTAEARGDMHVGAALEAQRPNRFAVGAALMRVQGRDRLLLEQYRRQARLDAATNGTNPAAEVPAAAPEVVRQRMVIPLDEYLRPGTPQPAVGSAVQPSTGRTFAPSEQLPPTIPERQSPAESPDPFLDDPPASSTTAPVVPPPATAPPSMTPPAEAPTDTSDEDPFGTF